MREIEKIWLTEDAVCIRTADGSEACEYYADYPRLKYASESQRRNFYSDDYGIHWPDVDEDLSDDGCVASKETTSLYKIFMAHPELNASAVARRIGISQSLFAQYISGSKKPSDSRLALIKETIRKIGQELLSEI